MKRRFKPKTFILPFKDFPEWSVQFADKRHFTDSQIAFHVRITKNGRRACSVIGKVSRDLKNDVTADDILRLALPCFHDLRCRNDGATWSKP